ncbi:MAG: BlaI/MecI/CopY family transcriptional regulator, partial [Euryarchaeota archaeon]|nr:BlaI/MecI/CopY family transcriptional regulator [Euryarchaeota archaeon]
MFDFEYTPGKRGIEKVLGRIESKIMRIMWEKKKATAKEIFEDLDEGKRSSVSILLKRLCEKDLLSREEEVAKGGMRYVYSVKVDKQLFERIVVKRVMDSLMNSFEQSLKEYLKER